MGVEVWFSCGSNLQIYCGSVRAYTPNWVDGRAALSVLERSNLLPPSSPPFWLESYWEM